MSDDVLETEDARTEYGLPKIWVKLAHAYTVASYPGSPVGWGGGGCGEPGISRIMNAHKFKCTLLRNHKAA